MFAYLLFYRHVHCTLHAVAHTTAQLSGVWFVGQQSCHLLNDYVYTYQQYMY